jgi:hypothetical protein
MYFLLNLAVAALIGLGGLRLANLESNRAVEVIGIQVKKKVVNGSWVADPEVAVEVMIRQPGKRIIGLSGIEVSGFTDDRKTDLAKNQDFKKSLDFPTRFKEGDRILFPLRSAVLPAKGATKLRAKASVGLRIGTDLTTLEKKNMKLKADVAVKVGPFELHLDQSNLGDDQTGVSVGYSDNIFKSIAFCDKDGKSVSSTNMGGGSSGGEQVYYHDHYGLERKLDVLSVRITYYSKSETIFVPFDLEVGLGF